MYDIGIQEASKAGKEGSAEILSHKKSGHAYYIRMGFNLNSGQTGLSFSLRGSQRKHAVLSSAGNICTHRKSFCLEMLS